MYQPVFSPPLQLDGWELSFPPGTCSPLHLSRTGFSPSPEFGHSHCPSPLRPHSQVLGWQMWHCVASQEEGAWQCNVHDLLCGPALCSRWVGFPCQKRTLTSPGPVCHPATSYSHLTHAERPNFQHHDHVYFKAESERPILSQ